MLILSQETKELSFHFSFSRSLALLSRALALFFSASLSLLLSHSLYSTQFIPSLSLSPSLVLTFSLFPFLSFSHLSFSFFFLAPSSIRLTSYLSPFLALCVFPFLFQFLSPSLFLRPTHLLNPTHFMSTICEQLAHNIITQNSKEHGRPQYQHSPWYWYFARWSHIGKISSYHLRANIRRQTTHQIASDKITEFSQYQIAYGAWD